MNLLNFNMKVDESASFKFLLYVLFKNLYQGYFKNPLFYKDKIFRDYMNDIYLKT